MMMVLRNTLWYDSDNKLLDQLLLLLLILVCSFQWWVLFLCLAKLHRSCPSPDKDLSFISGHIAMNLPDVY